MFYIVITVTYMNLRIQVFLNVSFGLPRQLGRELGRAMVISPQLCYTVLVE